MAVTAIGCTTTGFDRGPALGANGRHGLERRQRLDEAGAAGAIGAHETRRARDALRPSPQALFSCAAFAARSASPAPTLC
ncbi:hypothetical protein B7760_05421 [Burkholderia glumae]|nr:hypothetical protein B7760_05421 [Burkholderia glumae]